MLEIIIVVLFVWLFIKTIGVMFRVAWGAAKIAALLLLLMAMPALVLCMVFASGLVLLVPVLLLAVACIILNIC